MARRHRGRGRRRVKGPPTIDLHPCTTKVEATRYLRSELQRMRSAGIKKVLVIHGKGGGVLREWIANELWQFVAFTVVVTPTVGNDGCSMIEMS